MGVIGKERNSAPVISFSSESLNSLGISQPATPPERAAEPPEVQQRYPSQLVQRLEHHRQNQRTGARKSRRADNATALQTLIEDENENAELTIADFQPKTESAFTQLLTDNNNMRIWQYFITLDEKEQGKYLENISPKKRNSEGERERQRVGCAFTQIHLTEADGFTMVPRMSECGKAHAPYSEEQRFGSMDNHLQTLLRRRHLPLGMLAYLEEEIMEVFSCDSNAVYITQELTSMERLLVHALCQYNLLTSKSSTIAGKRRTKIENCQKCFHVPKISLTEYIENYVRPRK